MSRKKNMNTTYLSMMTPYLAAKTDQEAAIAVRNILKARAYNYWQGLTHALGRDRSGARDGQELFNATAPASRADVKANYDQVAHNWVQLAPQWDGLEHVPASRTTVRLGDLEVRVPKLNAERHPDGTLEVLYPHWRKDPWPLHVRYGVMRVVQLAHPGVEVAYIDVPRLSIVRSAGLDLSVYDEWLTQAGIDLAAALKGDDQDQADAA